MTLAQELALGVLVGAGVYIAAGVVATVRAGRQRAEARRIRRLLAESERGRNGK